MKSAIMILLLICGNLGSLQCGFANEIILPTIIPSFVAGMVYLTVIIFTYMGFEI